MSTLSNSADQHVLNAVYALRAADARDYRIMRWISAQASTRRLHERRHNRGNPIKRMHPLARIGMSV